MNRIKDLNNVIVQGSMLWCEVIVKEKSSLIIDPNAVLNIDYMIVHSVGEYVKDVKVGDVIIETATQNFDTIKVGNKQYVKVFRNVCEIIVPKDNFNFDK